MSDRALSVARQAPALPRAIGFDHWLLLALIAVFGGALWMQQQVDLRQGLLWLVGAGLGFTLLFTGFGFAGSWRRLLVERRGAGVRAQLLMLAVATVLFYPVLAQGSLFGQPLHAIVRPVGVSLLAGAFLFGIGMQLVGACSSGTLAGLGRLRPTLILALVGIVAGALLASAHYDWWSTRPAWWSFSLLNEFGLLPALTLNLGLIAALAGATLLLERRVAPSSESREAAARHTRWLLWGGLALAGLNFLTLLLAGRPWVIANAFPLWGAKLAELGRFELDLMFWEYWSTPAAQQALEAPLWHDVSSVMNIALIAGALLAASLLRASSSGSAPVRSGWGVWPATLIGSLLLGYGAIVGLGCNIGAFVGGVVSGSAHGWVWLLAALVGNAVGLGLRPVFGLKR